MHASASQASRDYAEWIARALATPGGHLAIGRGGFTLHYGHGWLSGYDCEPVKAACVDAGLPVIDSRGVAFERVWDLAVRGPMVAVDVPASEPPPLATPLSFAERSLWLAPPYHALSYAPLAVVGDAYRRLGAEVFNLHPPGTDAGGREEEGGAGFWRRAGGWERSSRPPVAE